MISGVSSYYETLGLWPGASLDEVRKAYRDLVQVWHPDRFAHNPELQHRAQEKLKSINESYSRIRSRQTAQSPRARGENAGTHTKAATEKYTAQQQNKAVRVKQRKALLVDGEAESRRALREFLSRKGYLVVEAQSESEAIPIYVQDRPDMVFLGTMQAGQANLETLRRLKTINPEASIFVASDLETTKPNEPHLAAGTYYVNKPIDFNYLGQAIQGDLGAGGAIVDITV